jgi:hypothetical protein
VFARQPCYPIPRPRDVGQWLCVPPFRVVCPYQALHCPAYGHEVSIKRCARLCSPVDGFRNELI